MTKRNRISAETTCPSRERARCRRWAIGLSPLVFISLLAAAGASDSPSLDYWAASEQFEQQQAAQRLVRLPRTDESTPLATDPPPTDASDSLADQHAPIDDTNAQQDAEPIAPGGMHGDTAPIPAADNGAALSPNEVPFDPTVFTADPDYAGLPYLPEVENSVYSGKYLNPTERPWIELGRGMYLPGRIPPSQTFLGEHNLVAQHFLVYGDFRTAVAYVDGGAKDKVVWARRLNLDLDWKITDTERVHAFVGPLDKGADFTRFEFDHGDARYFDRFDGNFDTVYFEGDLGSLLGGWRGHDSRFDMPFAVGLLPLLFQNGVWMEDAFVGAAVTLPARHSTRFDWANYDLTFFAGIDELNSPAFGRDDSAANVMGATAFIDAYRGYLEVGYAFLDDHSGRGLSYHNVGVSFTRRYLHRLSNSVRLIVNSGQDPAAGPRTAEGCLVLIENSLITSQPNTLVPYLNLFAGYGRPQSVARAAVSGGVLRNTGILFETDGLTGFPFLDDTGSNTYGGALGVNCLGPSFDYQVIAELAVLQTFGRAGGRRAVNDQYGVGFRYQLPLTNAWLLRMDALFGFLKDADNIAGGRVEMRYKF